jgi:hypothetical protein
MRRSACVIGWERDTEASGAQSLVAVNCKDRLALLENLVYKLGLGLDLDMRDILEIESTVEKIETEKGV